MRRIQEIIYRVGCIFMPPKRWYGGKARYENLYAVRYSIPLFLRVDANSIDYRGFPGQTPNLRARRLEERKRI